MSLDLDELKRIEPYLSDSQLFQQKKERIQKQAEKAKLALKHEYEAKINQIDQKTKEKIKKLELEYNESNESDLEYKKRQKIIQISTQRQSSLSIIDDIFTKTHSNSNNISDDNDSVETIDDDIDLLRCNTYPSPKKSNKSKTKKINKKQKQKQKQKIHKKPKQKSMKQIKSKRVKTSKKDPNTKEIHN